MKRKLKRELIICLAITMVIASQMGCGGKQAPSWGGLSILILLGGVLVIAMIRASRKIKVAQ